MIIKNASVMKIIGVESQSNGESYNHITIVIEAKRINPIDYKDIKSKCDVELNIL